MTMATTTWAASSAAASSAGPGVGVGGPVQEVELASPRSRRCGCAATAMTVRPQEREHADGEQRRAPSTAPSHCTGGGEAAPRRAPAVTREQRRCRRGRHGTIVADRAVGHAVITRSAPGLRRGARRARRRRTRPRPARATRRPSRPARVGSSSSAGDGRRHLVGVVRAAHDDARSRRRRRPRRRRPTAPATCGTPHAAASTNTMPKPSCSRPPQRLRHSIVNTSAQPYSARQVVVATRAEEAHRRVELGGERGAAGARRGRRRRSPAPGRAGAGASGATARIAMSKPLRGTSRRDRRRTSSAVGRQPEVARGRRDARRRRAGGSARCRRRAARR